MGGGSVVADGKRIGAVVLYLLHYQLLPEKRLATLMADLFGVRLATATIARISHDCAKRFQGFANVVRDQVAVALVKHMDETGFRIGGKTQWLHIASDHAAHFYRVLGHGAAACWLRWSASWCTTTGISYYTMTGVLHALCNAHHLRELKALVEIEKEDGRDGCSGCCAGPGRAVNASHARRTCRSGRR